MGLFRRHPGLYGQNDEVSPVCTQWDVTRRGRRYPHGTRSKLLLGAAPHLLSAAAELTLFLTFSTDPLLTVLQEIMTETRIWDPYSRRGSKRDP